MRKSVKNAIKRIKQNERIAKAYSMPVKNLDIKKNDEKKNRKKLYYSSGKNIFE